MQAEKYSLIEYIMGIKEASTIAKFKALVKSSEKDWWNEIAQEEKSEIEQGIKELNNGDVLTHKEVMSNPRKWN